GPGPQRPSDCAFCTRPDRAPVKSRSLATAGPGVGVEGGVRGLEALGTTGTGGKVAAGLVVDAARPDCAGEPLEHAPAGMRSRIDAASSPGRKLRARPFLTAGPPPFGGRWRSRLRRSTSISTAGRTRD